MAAIRAEGLSGPWAARLDASEALSVASLRLIPGLEVCEGRGELWLRGPRFEPPLPALLARVPGAVRYLVGDGGLLTLPGRLLPSGRLPERKWTLLRHWLVLKLQRVCAPGTPLDAVAPRLERGGPERPATVLTTTLERFAEWAATAPGVRLAPLSFAASPDGEAMVWGAPLPPIPGTRFWTEDTVAIPCGFTSKPRVDAQLLQVAAGLAPGDLLVYREDGSVEGIAAECFVRATRGAVRNAAEAARARPAPARARKASHD